MSAGVLQIDNVNRDGCARGSEKRAGLPFGLARLGMLLITVLLAVWSCDGVRVVWEGVMTALDPVPTCATEMHIVDGVRCIAVGQPLYPPVDGLPLAYHLYQPFTYLPAGWIGRTFGLDLDGMLVVGRLISLVSMLGVLGLVAWYLRRTSGSRWCAALAPAMLLYFHSSTLTDFFRNRPETPAILLSLAGWMIVQIRPRRWVVLSALAFVGAMSFKPTFVAAPLAACVQLVLERQWRAALQLVGAALVLGAGVVVGSLTLLGSGYFEHTVLAMAANPFALVERSIVFYSALAQMHWGALLPATLVSVAWLAYRKSETPLVVYLGVCFAVTTLAHGKIGSDLNYHGELSMLMVLVTATAIGRMIQARSRFAIVPVLCLFVGTLAAMIIHGLAWNGLGLNRMIPRPYWTVESSMPGAGEYVARYRALRGPALILDDEIAVRVGNPVVYDWYALSLSFSSGHLSFEPLEHGVRDRQFTAVVLNPSQRNDWAESLREAALESGYRLARRDERVEEYVAD